MELVFLYHPKPYLTNPNAQLGLGLLSVATQTKAKGARVSLVNAQDRTVEWAADAVPNGAVVCLSGCMVDGPILSRLGRLLRARGCYVAVGGPVAESPRIVAQDAADVIVRGPGEPVVDMLMRRYPPRQACSCGETVPLVVSVDERQDYNAFPIPDRTLLGGQGGNIFHARSGHATGRSATLVTSRGCRFGCAFCLSGGRGLFHEYPTERIDVELRQIRALDICDVRVQDDNAGVSAERLKALSRLMAKHKM